jgi:hypothetical protein
MKEVTKSWIYSGVSKMLGQTSRVRFSHHTEKNFACPDFELLGRLLSTISTLIM